jgi:hypothetical protein
MEVARKLYQCPICKLSQKPKERYPNLVCGSCTNQATDKQGRPLTFGNVSLSGGYTACYSDTKEPYDSHICYINDIACFANEAKFGSIVIEKI